MELPTPPDCGVTFFPSITTTPTLITSPNYPSNYKYGTTCDYHIKKNPFYASVKYILYLSFVANEFYIPGRMSNCDSNYLEIEIGEYENMQSIGRFCGNQKPFDVYSYKGRISMKLRTTSLASGKFKIYAYLKETTGQTCTTSSELPEYSGVIHSPSYPHGYHSGDNCDTTLQLPDGKTHIQFAIIDVNLLLPNGDNESSGDNGSSGDNESSRDYECDAVGQDYLEIRGTDDSSENFDQSKHLEDFIGKRCKEGQSRVSFVISKYRFLHVRFRSHHTTFQSNFNEEIKARGFYIGYMMYSPYRPYKENMWWVYLILVLFIFIIIICIRYLHRRIHKQIQIRTKIQNLSDHDIPSSQNSNQTLQGNDIEDVKGNSSNSLTTKKNMVDSDSKSKEVKFIIQCENWAQDECNSLWSLHSEAHLLSTSREVRADDLHSVRTMESMLPPMSARSLNRRRHSHKGEELDVTPMEGPAVIIADVAEINADDKQEIISNEQVAQ